MVYFFSRFTLATKLTKVVLFEVALSGVALSGIWQKEYFSFFKVTYLSSSKAEVSRFTTLP